MNRSNDKDPSRNQDTAEKSQSSLTADSAVSQSPFEAIKPTQVPLTATYKTHADAAGTNSTGTTDKRSLWHQHRALFIALPTALILLLAVVFVLPALIGPASVPEREVTAAISNPPTPAANNRPNESPWTDAQIAKVRRETQDILAKLLDRQKNLEDMQVQRWGQEPFQAAADLASQADELYREQNYPEAKDLYQQALARFSQLVDDSEVIFTDSINNGYNAIDAGNSKEALSNFEIAALIHPESRDVQTGLDRAGVLDRVLELIKQGSRHQRQGELDEAKTLFSEALGVDKDSTAAQTKLAEINAAIKERNYGKAMSRGFAALNGGNFADAIGAFQQALRIKPGAADAKAALTQAQNQNTQTTLQQLVASATEAENNERWQQAVDNYERALQLDGNLVQAKVGKIKAEYRAEIDKRLEDILTEPDRLTSPAVFKEYQQLGREVRDMKDRGPRLQGQFEQLEQAMRRAIAPVDIVLQSDNETAVTIYRVGELGKFEQQELTLQPGTYTVVGTREGYRDVHREITVSANNENSPVVIRCVERIHNG